MRAAPRARIRPNRRAIGPRWLIAIGALAALTACRGTAGPPPSSPSPAGPLGHGTATISTADGRTFVLQVEIAETAETQQRGLMGRTNLDADAGMAFLFPDLADRAFYMKDTLIPLAIAFWGTNGRIVGLAEMTPCHTDPCPLTHSPAPAVGALEANAGFFTGHGVAVGDQVVVRRS